MDGDDAGSMDFMEGMIATMAVAIVLTAFLGLMAGTAVTGSDPLDDIDPSELTAEIREGEFVPLFGDYIAGYADTHGLRGISISTEVPGGFCGEHDPVTFGDVSDPTEVRRFSTVVETDDGRRIVAVHEVAVCA